MAEAYSSFLSIKLAWEYCFFPLDGMLIHGEVTSQQYVSERQSGVKLLV